MSFSHCTRALFQKTLKSITWWEYFHSLGLWSDSFVHVFQLIFMYFYTSVDWFFLRTISIQALIIFFSLGLGPIPWVIMSEVCNFYFLNSLGLVLFWSNLKECQFNFHKLAHVKLEYSNLQYGQKENFYLRCLVMTSWKLDFLFPTFWKMYFQILPVNIKGLAGSVATLANWLISFVVTMTANLLLNWSDGGLSVSNLSLSSCVCRISY